MVTSYNGVGLSLKVVYMRGGLGGVNKITKECWKSFILFIISGVLESVMMLINVGAIPFSCFVL